MYLVRDQPYGNGLSESRSVVDEDVVVIGNEQRPETGSQQSQSQLLPQSHLQLQPLTTISSTYARDRETDPMRQHSSAWKLRDDDNDDDDDDDDDDENEEEQPDDDKSHFSAATERRAPPRVILVGWDDFRTKLLLFLIACLLLWACVFFPLLGT